MINVEHIFPVPIWSIDLDLNLNEIETYIRSIKNVSNGRAISNVNGWQSDSFDTKQETIPEIKRLFYLIQKYLKLCYAEYGSAENPEIDNYWFNINYPGSSNLDHLHSRCFLSGCFYVNTSLNCGDIVFKSSSFEDYIISSNVGLSNTKLSASHWKYSTKPNQVLIFPSWISHFVEENKSSEDRISIAFNTRSLKWE